MVAYKKFIAIKRLYYKLNQDTNTYYIFYHWISKTFRFICL